jgi:predicted nucleotidyltransferase
MMAQAQKMALEKIFRSDARIQLVYLFGSRARQEATSASDYDIAYLTQCSLPLDAEADLNCELMKALSCDRIDMVALREAPILLRFEAVSEGVLIFQNLEDTALNQFELSIYREFFHTERFRKLQSQELRQAFTEV